LKGDNDEHLPRKSGILFRSAGPLIANARFPNFLSDPMTNDNKISKRWRRSYIL